MASSERQASRTERRSSGTEASSLEKGLIYCTCERGSTREDVPHVDPEASKGSHSRVEIVSKSDVNITDLILVDGAFAPLCE